MVLSGRLNGVQRNRLKGLFDMLYTPKELADEIGINVNQIYSVYISLDCPMERNQANRILINGKAFANWYSSAYAKIRMGEDQSFCKTCKKGVEIISPVQKKKGNLIYVLSSCPNCGRGLTRIISNDK